METKNKANKGNNIAELEFTGERVVPSKTPYVTYQEHINRYSFASKFIKNKIVLDVASGTGYGSYVVPIKTDYIWGCCNVNGIQINVYVIFMQSY